MVKTRTMLALAIGALALGSMALTQPPAGQPKDAPKDAQPKEKAKPSAAEPAARIGETAPDFTLTDTEGKSHHLADLKGKIVLLEWFNPDCPVIQMHHKENKTFNDLYTAYSAKNVVFLGINSSADGKEGSGKDRNAKSIKEFGLQYPVALDADGKVGHLYGAKTTPHVFIVAADGTLAYMGAIDSGSARKPGEKNFAKQALDELIAGKKVSETSTRPYGCSVKY